MNLEGVKEIMLIDDDEATNYLSKFIINGKNCCEKLSVFCMAEHAIDDLKNRIKHLQELPDVIFLDLNMPRLNGWEFLDIYEQFDLSYTDTAPTIIILSTSMNPEDEVKASQVKAASQFLQKPLSEDILDRVMSLRSSQLSG